MKCPKCNRILMDTSTLFDDPGLCDDCRMIQIAEGDLHGKEVERAIEEAWDR